MSRFRQDRVCVGILVCSLVLGCAEDRRPREVGRTIPAHVQEVLSRAAELELFSLDPNWAQKPKGEHLRGWRILGRTRVENPATRDRLITALERGVQEYSGTAAKCFNPRHGIRASYAGATVEMVLCFECFQAEVYPLPESQFHRFLVSSSPQPLFDSVLRDAARESHEAR